MPHARNAYRVAIPWRSDNWRNVAGIIFRGPHTIARNLERRNPDPLAVWRAVVIEVQARMINQNGEATTDQHHDKTEIEEVAASNPKRKAVRSGEVIGIDLG